MFLFCCERPRTYFGPNPCRKFIPIRDWIEYNHDCEQSDTRDLKKPARVVKVGRKKITVKFVCCGKEKRVPKREAEIYSRVTESYVHCEIKSFEIVEPNTLVHHDYTHDLAMKGRSRRHEPGSRTAFKRFVTRVEENYTFTAYKLQDIEEALNEGKDMPDFDDRNNIKGDKLDYVKPLELVNNNCLHVFSDEKTL